MADKVLIDDPALDNEPGLVPGEGDEGRTKTEGKMTIPPKKEEVVPATPLKEGEPTKPFKSFESQEEYDEFIKGEKAKAVVESIEKYTKKPEKGEDEETLKFFQDDFNPKDWNEYTLNLLKNPIVAKFLAENLAPKVGEVLEGLTTSQEKEMEELDKGFDKQYDGMVKEGKVPARDTEEGKKIDKQITDIGAKYGMGSMVDAYNLWSEISTEHGGGAGYMLQKTHTQERKQKSGLIGNNRKSAGTPATTKLSYKDIHGKSLDTLIQEEDLSE